MNSCGSMALSPSCGAVSVTLHNASVQVGQVSEANHVKACMASSVSFMMAPYGGSEQHEQAQ